MYFSNTASIISALVVAKGDISLVGGGPVLVTGSVISTGGTVTMTNNATVTYDAAVVSAVLTENSGLFTSGVGGTGGSITVTPQEWRKL